MAQQVFLITGGAGGIGSSLARILVERGDRLVLFGRTRAPLESLEAELGGPQKALAIQGDARQSIDLENAVAQAVSTFGRLDGLAHCVGSILLKPLHLTTPEEFVSVLETNLISAFMAARSVIGQLRVQGGGSIVLVSSVAASQGLNSHEAISAAKAGIEGLVRSAAISYARQNIRFNAVAPGLTETPLAAPLLRNESARAFSESIHPLGRLGQAKDQANAIAFLLGPEAGWVTGQVWRVDGGLSAGYAPPRTVVTRT